jgi:hypothetical protein
VAPTWTDKASTRGEWSREALRCPAPCPAIDILFDLDRLAQLDLTHIER